jgi:peroxiredoxin
VALPIAFDADGKALGSYGVTSMPTMFVIDTKSKLAFTHVGFSKEKGFDELDEALKGIK